MIHRITWYSRREKNAARRARDVADNSTVNVGRSSGNDIVLADPGISRNHARIRISGGKAEFTDLGSSNGLTVGGKRVAQAVLQPGKSLEIGDYVFSYERSATAASAHAPAVAQHPPVQGNTHETFVMAGHGGATATAAAAQAPAHSPAFQAGGALALFTDAAEFRLAFIEPARRLVVAALIAALVVFAGSLLVVAFPETFAPKAPEQSFTETREKVEKGLDSAREGIGRLIDRLKESGPFSEFGELAEGLLDKGARAIEKPRKDFAKAEPRPYLTPYFSFAAVVLLVLAHVALARLSAPVLLGVLAVGGFALVALAIETVVALSEIGEAGRAAHVASLLAMLPLAYVAAVVGVGMAQAALVALPLRPLFSDPPGTSLYRWIGAPPAVRMLRSDRDLVALHYAAATVLLAAGLAGLLYVIGTGKEISNTYAFFNSIDINVDEFASEARGGRYRTAIMLGLAIGVVGVVLWAVLARTATAHEASAFRTTSNQAGATPLVLLASDDAARRQLPRSRQPVIDRLADPRPNLERPLVALARTENAIAGPVIEDYGNLFATATPPPEAAALLAAAPAVIVVLDDTPVSEAHLAAVVRQRLEARTLFLIAPGAGHPQRQIIARRLAQSGSPVLAGFAAQVASPLTGAQAGRWPRATAFFVDPQGRPRLAASSFGGHLAYVVAMRWYLATRRRAASGR